MPTKLFRALLPLAFFACMACPPCAPAQAPSAGTAQTTATAPAGTKLYFFVHLTPPRPTFATDMTADERTLMGKHVVYWTALFNQGKVLVFGPVQDPRGAFGVAVVEVASREEAQRMIDNDPTVQAGLNKMELAPMMVGLHR